MKKVFYPALILLSLAIHAQTKGKFRTDLDVGLMFPSGGGLGMSVDVEPKYNLASNMNLGLRLSSGAAVQEMDSSSKNTLKEERTTVVTSIIGTYDYYFNRLNTSTIPYIGAGLGYFSLINAQAKSGTSLNDFKHLDHESRLGGMLRLGIETGKFRFGVDYHLIPKTKIQSISGSTLGYQNNNYFTFHFGLFIGGGKWKKHNCPLK